MPAILPSGSETDTLGHVFLLVVVAFLSSHRKHSHMIVGLAGAMASLLQAPTANLTCGKNKTLWLSPERAFYFLEFSEVLLYHV